jgi:proteasome lid subunit RPN8/RPN11
MKRAVRSRRKVYGQLLRHARRQPHRECCGILAGQDGLITQAFPAKNVAADPVRNYEIAAKEIVRLMTSSCLGEKRIDPASRLQKRLVSLQQRRVGPDFHY